jgi:hypothetical protein
MPGDLKFVWYDPRKGAAIGESWGQLAGALDRLVVVAGYLEELPGRKRTEVALEQVTYHLEGYFARVYELRERAVELTKHVLNRDVSKAKNPKHRAAVVASVPERYRHVVAPFFALLQLLDEDVNLRNTHTHHQSLNLVLVVPTGTLGDRRFVGVYDPLDVLMETENEPEAKATRKAIRDSVRRVAGEYHDRARNILRETLALLETTAPFTQTSP